MTLHAAMYKVLKESPQGKLRAGEIISGIGRQGLYRMRDGRLPESQQIHARASHNPDLFGKDGSFPPEVSSRPSGHLARPGLLCIHTITALASVGRCSRWST